MDLRQRTKEDWERILAECGCRPIKAAAWAPVFADTLKGSTVLSAGEAELDDLLGQLLHESGMLQATVENLNYSAQALLATWPSRFDSDSAALYEHRPEAIANKVYANRMGNGDEASGDGWRFRGRGLIMITGRYGYQAAGDLCGQDLEQLPELLEQPHYALESAICWWEGQIPDAFLGDLVKVTKRVNGGTIGIAHRKQVTEAATRALRE